jgi:hypothetical protein
MDDRRIPGLAARPENRRRPSRTRARLCPRHAGAGAEPGPGGSGLLGERLTEEHVEPRLLVVDGSAGHDRPLRLRSRHPDTPRDRRRCRSRHRRSCQAARGPPDSLNIHPDCRAHSPRLSPRRCGPHRPRQDGARRWRPPRPSPPAERFRYPAAPCQHAGAGHAAGEGYLRPLPQYRAESERQGRHLAQLVPRQRHFPSSTSRSAAPSAPRG